MRRVTGGSLEVGVGQFQVVPAADPRTVAHPVPSWAYHANVMNTFEQMSRSVVWSRTGMELQ